MGSVRFLVAGGILYVLTIRSGDTRGDRLGLRQWMAALLISSLMLVAGNGGVILAEQYVAIGVVALLVATAPLWMAVIDPLGLGRGFPALVTGLRLVAFCFVALLIL